MSTSALQIIANGSLHLMYDAICRQRTENRRLGNEYKMFIYFTYLPIKIYYVIISIVAVFLVKGVAKPATITASFPGLSSVVGLTSNIEDNLSQFLAILIHLTTLFFLQEVMFTIKNVCPIAANSGLCFI